ncbi:unnamed protein product [Lactuca virosa]|uniref:Protein ABIL1 n=1 Tax=Lactuca virosa TaxID=75947 RepID=A0AAU9LEN1_9ASTR|nr:unnamed protein product [Lactuca virosa]
MEVEQSNQGMTIEEASMEQSIGFVKALQELKNLRPQLYSAAEYCEKSYLHSDQKQMVLDNLKDYAIRALSSEISSTELHLTCLHQQLLTCQTYTDKEAIRQQELLAVLPRHHKRYILPNSVSKKVHFSPQIQTDSNARQSNLQPRTRQFTSGTPASNTLSWHLATETKSTLKGGSRPLMSMEDPKPSRRTPSNGEEGMQKRADNLRLSNVGPASTTAMQTLGIIQRDPSEGQKPMTPFRSFDNQTRPNQTTTTHFIFMKLLQVNGKESKNSFTMKEKEKE